jgi:hypothetical protein
VIAQNEMAMWAFGMLVITGLGVALSGAGVWLIWGTLIRTGEIARDTKITAPFFWGETPKEDLMMMRNSDLDYGST